jgi:hypothetical protein
MRMHLGYSETLCGIQAPQHRETAESRRVEQEARARRALVNKMYKDASSIDLAFLVDATSSMRPYTKAVAEQCIAIAKHVRRSCGVNRSLRFAFVAYRDYEDVPSVEFLDFTHKIKEFKVFVRGVVATGGGDACEDVFSGLEKAGQLSWNTAQGAARALYHMADSPCHGRRFDNFGTEKDDDHYLDGDLQGRDLKTLLSRLQTEIGIFPYTFSHIHHSGTCKMVEEFRNESLGLQWITKVQLGTKTSRLTEQVSSSVSTAVTASITAATMVAAPVKVQRPYKVDPNPSTGVDWASIRPMRARQTRHIPPASLEELLQLISEAKQMKLESRQPVYLKVAKDPFAEDGACR